MKTIILIVFIPFLICAQEITKPEIINPKGNWYFGAEIGLNTITSFNLGEHNKSFQGGVLAEYYTGRHWSLCGRIKYFETGVSFYRPNTHSGSWFDLGHDESFGTFKGAVITIPIDIKWEFRVHKNLGASLKMGYTYNFETKSNYSNYSNNSQIDYPKKYHGFNAGYGLNYFLSKKIAVYIDVEFYSGDSKGYSDGFFGKTAYLVENHLTNVGIKYNFKK
jgi:Outer membrane protein beta-barrel domain